MTSKFDALRIEVRDEINRTKNVCLIPIDLTALNHDGEVAAAGVKGWLEQYVPGVRVEYAQYNRPDA